MKKQQVIMAAVFVMAVACNNNPSAEGTPAPTAGDSTALPTATPLTDPADSVIANTANVDSTGTPAPGVDKNEKKYTNDKGETITAVYHDSGNMGVAELTINGETVKLMKGEKEKGATVYTNGKLTWKVNADEASLEKDNVITVYKTVK
ncbi:cytochrome c class I [Niabella sp.]|uniref:cytochrome c class I n=1 Tax=Niabella sp. TaxID=1962976 RepID=UPI002632353E|nr:cytochrome c class I [Niabella sp.]